MNNVQKIGLFVGLTSLWYYVLRGAKALSVRMVDLGFSGVNLMGETVALRPVFRVVNPLFVSAFVRNVVGELYIMDAKVADVNAVINRPIRANSVTDLTVPVDATFSGLSEAVRMNIETGDIRTLLVNFRGSIGIGKDRVVNIPLNIALTWEELR